MSQHNRPTPAKQALKRKIATVLHADDERATIGAVAAYLGVSCRSLMSAKRDPRTAENSHFVSASTLLPPGYTPEELVKFNFNPKSRVWRPGPEFNRHMDTRLQQMFPPASGVSAPSVSTQVDLGETDTHASAQPPAPITPPQHVSAGTHVPANPDLTALLQHVVYHYLGSNYPMSGDRSLADAGPLYRSRAIIVDLYNHVRDHSGDPRELA